MAQTVVQTSANTAGSGTSASVLMPGVGTGNLLVVAIINDSDGTTTFTVTDNQGGVWTNVVSAGHGAPVNGLVCISYANDAAGGDTTVTVTAGSSITFNFYVFEIGGSATSGVVGASDSDVVTSGTELCQASVAGITTITGAFVVVVAVESVGTTNTPESGWTALTGAHGYDFFEYKLFTGMLSDHGTWTSSSNITYVAAIAAFLAGSSSIGAGPFKPIIINPAVHPAILE